MADYRKRELTTKDGVPLSELLNTAVATFDAFNEADRPFRGLLAQTVSEQIFRTAATGDMTWEELAEGEHARTGSIESAEVEMHVAKYGKSLGFTQEFVQDNPAEEVTKRFQIMVEGALKKEHDVLMETLQNGVADGGEIWYGATEYGAYSFSATHDHTFADSAELLGGAGTPTAHLREANAQLRHHGKRPTVGLCSSEFAAEFVDELAYNASYHIPDATSLRSSALPETQIRVDGVSLFQTPHLADTGSSYTFYVLDDSKPIYLHEKQPMMLTNGEYGGPVGDPGALLGAYGSARYGAKMVDPLAAVKVTADQLA